MNGALSSMPHAPAQWAGRLSSLFMIASLVRGSAAILVVTNGADSGSGTLRQEISDANASTSSNMIVFQIPGAGTHTINLTTALPTVAYPMFIDGTTQPGFAGTPVIELNGQSAGNSVGLRISAGNSTVRGLAINGFAAQGILVQGLGTNIIAGNYIGIALSGTSARANSQQGIWINGSRANVIGGTGAGDRNVISGNGDAGVYLFNADGNKVLGNYIGMTAAGTGSLGNGNNGISISSCSGNVIGQSNSGAGNVISGNGGSGVYISGGGSHDNMIQNNLIGTDVRGTVNIGNAGDGITIQGATRTIIGGSEPAAGNVISGNSKGGISFNSATNNSVLGNFIGTDWAGRSAIGNQFAGVTLSGSISNVIGDIAAGSRNVIASNNKDGLFLTNSSGNLIAGNNIGVDVTGTNALANGFNGITLAGANSNTIGGVSAAARNIISGNAGYGIQLSSSAMANEVVGNYIGTDSSGNSALPNHFSGVEIESPSNVVGGGPARAGNLISGNMLDGVNLLGPNARSNVVRGNFIGTESRGASQLGNNRGGIGVSDAGGNQLNGNVISGNGDAGIYLIGSGVTGNEIQGNIVGADATGALPVGNQRWGIYVERGSSNTIGGTIPVARNLISANGTWGILLTNSSWMSIVGNYIGTAADGQSALGNGNTLAGFHAIEIQAGSHDNTIGGTEPGAGNRIAYAPTVGTTRYSGIRIRDGSTNNLLSGNAIFSNGGLGIDLGGYLVSSNDLCDADLGANQLQNFPALTQAVSGSGTGVRGTLSGIANSTFDLQFFANPVCGSVGFGEGQIFLGTAQVTTDGSCSASFLAKFAVVIPAGYVVSATATDSANNTSEFSACVPVVTAPSLGIKMQTNQQISLVWSNIPSGFILKETGNLTAPVQWATVTNHSMSIGDQIVVSISMTMSNTYYRLSLE